MINWNALPYLVASEVKQRKEEGYAVDGFAQAVAEAQGNEARLRALYDEMQRTPQRADFAFIEPTALDEIRREQAISSVTLSMPQRQDAEWEDRFSGAFLRRCVGCALGKPLEEAP